MKSSVGSLHLPPAIVLMLAVAAASSVPKVCEAQTAAKDGTARLEIELQRRDGLNEALPLVVTLQPAGDAAERIRREGTAPGALTVDLPQDTSWAIAAEAPGWWSATSSVRLGEADQRISMQLEPGGTMTATLVDENGEPLGAGHSVSARLLPVSSKDVLRARTSPCRPGSDAKGWICALPEGRWDVRLRAQGFVSHFLWDFRIGRGESVSAGAFRLRPGASVTGWVEVHGDPEPGSKAEVTLKPATIRAASVSDADVARERRAAIREHVVSALANGFFHFPDVEPGTYEISAEQPGLAPARLFGIEVAGTNESALREPLILGELSALTLELDPVLGPGERPWHVALVPYSPTPASMEPAASGLADPNGMWESIGVAPGEYWLRVLSEEGNVWHSSVQEIEPNAFMKVSLPLVRVLGIVRLGVDPLAAQLRFWGDGERIDSSSDDDGAFAVTLPRPGYWEVEVTSKEHWVKRRLPIEVDEPQGARTVELEIDLPNGRLRGRVVDLFGRPVPRTMVLATLVPKERVRTQQVDEDGRFELAGLDRGTIRLHAWDMIHEARSPQIESQVGGGSVPEVTLVVEPTEVIRGRVVDGGSAVPNARLVVEPSHAPLTWLDPVVTGFSGDFEIRLPAGTRRLNVAVHAQSYSQRLMQVAIPEPNESGERDPVLVPVDRGGGDLLLEFEHPPRAEFVDGYAHVLFHQGDGYVLLDFLRSWALLNGARAEDPSQVLVPRVEDGFYRFCRLRLENLWQALRSSSPRESSCASGYLSGGSVLSLQVSDNLGK